MPSIDDRIVKIEFDNAQFKSEISNTLAALADLNKGLNLSGAEQGSRSLAGIGSAVDSIASHFRALSVVGITVIADLTTAALGLVKKLGKDVLDPIFSGGLNRAKNIEQAKFMFQGLGIDVDQAMASSLAAVKGTAFGLDEAAKAAAQFGASGIKVGTDMTSALRGVAGAAALTGKSFTEIADIFAGSAGSGKVTNQDLLQFATRGLNAAAAVGKVMGKTEAQVHEMAANGTLDFKTFAAAMDSAFGAHATEANKTFTGALANVHAALSRLGASFIAPQLEHFRDLFNALSPVIDGLTTALGPLLLVFTHFTEVLNNEVITGLNKISFKGLSAAMPILVKGLFTLFDIFQKVKLIAVGAFQHIFPSDGVSVFVKIADAIQKFANALEFGAAGGTKLYNIFSGVFAVLSIGWTIIKEGAKFLLDLGKAIVTAFGGDAVDGVQKVANFFVNLQQSLVKGEGIKTFFKGLGEVLSIPVGWLVKLRDAIAHMFGGFDKKSADAIDDVTGRIGDRFKTLHEIVDKIKGLWKPFADFASKVSDALGKAWATISGFFDGLGQKIVKALGSKAFSGALDALNTGLLAVLTAGIVKWIKNGFNIGVGVSIGPGQDLMSKINGIFTQLTGTLKTLQIQIKSEALLKIAYAIGILTASVVVLSLIDSASLTKALTAMAVGFAQLMGAFAILTKLTLTPKAAASFALLSAGFILLAAAMVVLAIAAKILSTMSWEELAKGLLGILVLIGLLVIAAKLLAKETPGMIRAGIGIGAMSVGLLLMAVAVKAFGSMDLESLAKGLGSIAVGLGIIALAMKVMPSGPEVALTGIGLFALGLGLIEIASALKIFATMSWDEIGRGLTAMAGGLALILIPLAFIDEAFPGGVALIGVGLILVAAGLNIFAGAMKIFSSMSWDEIARGLTALGGSLAILAIGVTGMSGALIGAVALGIVAASLIVLSTALKVIGKMSWDDLTDGLLKLAVAIGAVALIALVLSPAVPLILALGVALLVVGTAFAVFGAGAFLAAKAFSLIATAGVAGAKGVKAALEVVGESMSALGKGLAKGLLDTIQVFADGIGKLIPAFSKIADALLTALEKNLPKAMVIMRKLLDNLVQLVYEYGPQFILVGIFMLETFLQGIRENIKAIVDIVSEIITSFLDALKVDVPNIISSLTDLITTIMTSLATNLGKLAATLWPTIGIAFVKGFVSGINSDLSELSDLLGDLPQKIIDWIGDALTFLYQKGIDLIQGILNGIGSILSTLSDFFTTLPGKIRGWVGDALGTLFQKGKDLIQGLWNGAVSIFNSVTDWASHIIGWIGDKIPNPLDALKQIGKDIIQGLWNGIKAIWHEMTDWIGEAVSHLPGPIKHFLESNSPSKVFMRIGEDVSGGFFLGIRNVWESSVDSAFNTPKLMSNINKAVQQVGDAINDVDLDVVPVIAPVLDLTQVAIDAKKIGSYISDGAIVPKTSFDSAQSIATVAKEVTPEKSPEVNSGITFQQTINSPTQLSTADIYKATRNQITIAKEELAIK